jgi:N-acetyl sugar amidotransferase
MRYCTRCVYPQIAVNLNMEDSGICSACRVAEEFGKLTPSFWDKRRQRFEKIVEEIKSRKSADYDVIIPVSGGKDSYYQTHVICKEYGLKPLLVTYHGNNYLPEGDYNRDRMRQVFNADHMVFGPSVEVLKKLNRLCFRKMGDMNWHCHCGINTYPFQIAVKFKIPYVVYGEISWDISGMYDPDDYVEFRARGRHEHALRGYEWYDLINDPVDPVEERDMLWSKFPSDDEMLSSGVRGIYIGNFFKWDPNWHQEMVQEKYGFKPSDKPFERTYRKFSNLDDRYENGLHDYLKFVKFGYGRASDHASKDIRSGYMTREQGIEMVRKYDSVVPSDLYYWLDYVKMTEKEFWETANRFRDKRVWRYENGQWVKDNIWDHPPVPR